MVAPYEASRRALLARATDATLKIVAEEAWPVGV